MKKYWVLFLVSLQDAFSERASALVWAFLDFLGPLMMLFIWLAIYQGQSGGGGLIGGFNLSRMLTYYFGVALISAVATAHNEWDVAREIQMGELSLYLTRPFSYLAHHFLNNLAWKVLKGVCVAPFLLLAFFLFRPFLELSFSGGQLLVFLLVVSLSYLLYFLNSMVFGLIAFWLEEYGSIVELNEMIRALFSGAVLPISFFPGALLTLGQLLPYRLLYDLPLRVLSGKAGGDELLSGAALQLFWLGFFFILYRFLWRSGVRHYSASGG